MAAVEILSFVDSQKVLNSWQASDGPTEEEKIKFAEAALVVVKDDKNKLADNVKSVGIWANQIDVAFDNVTRGFKEMVVKYSHDFPEISDYLAEWNGYKANWVKYLSESRDVASTHIVILNRFNHVFLEMVEGVKTDRDRLEVIPELQSFIDEDHGDSARMSQNFLNLKRDIEDFVRRFGQWIFDKGVQLDAREKQLILGIEGLHREIEVLEGKIYKATTAFAVCGGLLTIVGLVAGSLLIAFQAELNGKIRDLSTTRDELAEVSRKQAMLANLKIEFDGLKPDIALICDRLVLFAEIWALIRSQIVQFQGYLKGGMDTLTNLRFKLEVRLARDVCTPLVEGLSRYATELENHGK